MGLVFFLFRPRQTLVCLFFVGRYFRVDTKQQSAQKSRAPFFFYFLFFFLVFLCLPPPITPTVLFRFCFFGFFFFHCRGGGSGEVTVTNNRAIIARQTKWPTEKDTHTHAHF